MSTPENLMIVADSEHDANMLYATGMFVPDPFIYLRLRGRSYLVMSDLEIDRARKQAPHCRILSLSQYQKKLRGDGIKNPGFPEIIRRILREQRIPRILVPQNFPYGLATELQRLHIEVKPKAGSFFPERELKSAAEVKHLSAALRMAEAGMAAAMEALRSARLGKNRRLIYQGAPLTSERLRAVIDTTITQANGLASHTIVAGGKQGCDPHETGFGPLRAHEPIILDIFPRSQLTGYFGDITRTVVRGPRERGDSETLPHGSAGTGPGFPDDAARSADRRGTSDGPGVFRPGRIQNRQAQRPDARLLPRHRARPRFGNPRATPHRRQLSRATQARPSRDGRARPLLS